MSNTRTHQAAQLALTPFFKATKKNIKGPDNHPKNYNTTASSKAITISKWTPKPRDPSQLLTFLLFITTSTAIIFLFILSMNFTVFYIKTTNLSNSRQSFAKATIRDDIPNRNQPSLLFVHIPKTGGSSLLRLFHVLNLMTLGICVWRSLEHFAFVILIYKKERKSFSVAKKMSSTKHSVDLFGGARVLFPTKNEWISHATDIYKKVWFPKLL